MATKTVVTLQFTICFAILLRINLFSVQLLCGSCLQRAWRVDLVLSGSLKASAPVTTPGLLFPVVEKQKNRRPKYGSTRLIPSQAVQEQLGR